MEMNDDLRDMALNRYGYGCWEAPYWFLGVEEGVDSKRESVDRRERIATWRELGSLELDDCREFHDCLYDRLNTENPLHGKGAKLQRTWKNLIRALMVFDGKLQDSEDYDCRLKYQKEKWGYRTSETCVIEFSGLATRNTKDRGPHTLYRAERIKFLREKICLHNPQFVAVYGTSDRKPWGKISEGASREIGARIIDMNGRTFAEFRLLGRTILVLEHHPLYTAPENWKKLGTTLRRLVDESPQA